jgi:RND family efflux transporter MFP subunit
MNQTKTGGVWGILKKLLAAAAFIAVVVVLMLYLAGAFHDKVAAGAAELPGRAVGNDVHLAPAVVITRPAVEEAVGTIRPVYQSTVSAKIMEKVIEINVIAGQKVQKGQVLVRLDDRTLKNNVQQAQSAMDSAQARRDQAKTRYEDIKAAFDKKVATHTELSDAENAYKGAEAELAHALDTVASAKINLTYATIESPMNGTIIDKKVDVGDTVSPGQTLLVLFDPGRMQLIASVRESLALGLKIGQPIGVRIEAIGQSCTGTVSEIVPEASSVSRTFSVKVTGPCKPGVYAGMFGRLQVPLDQERLLVIPAAAVQTVGQLTMVEVAKDNRLLRRAVQLGQKVGDDQVQVLSGLSEGESLALPK